MTEFPFGVPQVLKLMNTNLTHRANETARRVAQAAGSDRQPGHRGPVSDGPDPPAEAGGVGADAAVMSRSKVARSRAMAA